MKRLSLYRNEICPVGHLRRAATLCGICCRREKLAGLTSALTEGSRDAHSKACHAKVTDSPTINGGTNDR